MNVCEQSDGEGYFSAEQEGPKPTIVYLSRDTTNEAKEKSKLSKTQSLAPTFKERPTTLYAGWPFQTKGCACYLPMPSTLQKIRGGKVSSYYLY